MNSVLLGAPSDNLVEVRADAKRRVALFSLDPPLFIGTSTTASRCEPVGLPRPGLQGQPCQPTFLALARCPPLLLSERGSPKAEVSETTACLQVGSVFKILSVPEITGGL